MEPSKLNPTQRYIYNQEKYWFGKFRGYIDGKVLKIGNGLGYMSSFIAKHNPDLTILDIELNESALCKDKVTIYDGKHFPYPDDSFDCVVSYLVLHHTPNPMQLIVEMARVARRIIILEETYTNALAKADLITRDISVNRLAGQPSKIFKKSYFRKDQLDGILQRHGFETRKQLTEKKRAYYKELYIADKTIAPKHKSVV